MQAVIWNILKNRQKHLNHRYYEVYFLEDDNDEIVVNSYIKTISTINIKNKFNYKNKSSVTSHENKYISTNKMVLYGPTFLSELTSKK